MTKLFIITKNQYSGNQRKIGFFRFQNNDLYFDFGMFNGSHTSYHRDGSIWRTSPVTGGKAKKEDQRVPIGNFKGFYNLGVILFTKRSLSNLPMVKQRDFKKHITYEIDIESLPSPSINIVSELIEPGYIFPLPTEEFSPPPNAISKVFTELTPWISLTILGHPNNLLVVPGTDGFTVKHFNKRFSAGGKGNVYSHEAYSLSFIQSVAK
ncbi:MAG: hypothetical protein MUO31_02790 [Thermodesulfovibrionales bacterium]|nr:hypothetical protein [Thermodesulfovibrionales bacterium]